jgi:uncharacterized SAM-binding protein YcdF (DUF218 family)
VLYIGRLLTAFVSPIVLSVLIFLDTGLFFRRRCRFSSLTAAALLLFSGSGFGSHLLVRALESRYAAANIDSAPAEPVIVVLGGGLVNIDGPAGAMQLGPHVERLWAAAQLYRARKAPLILVSGGNSGPITGASLAESELAAHVLAAWGIPPSAILTEKSSLTTHENAVFTHRILMQKGIDHILLVTSAIHMPRALATFRRTGLAVYPIPADFLSGKQDSNFILFVIPGAENLANCGFAIKEFMGIVAYRLRGWTD